MAKQKYYVVWEGKIPGIYLSWEDCKKQTDGYPNPVFKSFKSKEIAELAYQEGSGNYLGIDERILAFTDEQRELVGNPIANSLSVDAACSGNPGILEYRGVYTSSGREVFKMGPFPQGTVNLGEFLALVHGLAMLKQRDKTIPVYSDSRTAMSWVKRKKVNTKLGRTKRNEKLFQLVDRALDWLNKNSYPNKILKWETKYWGEIPADFGRK